MTSTLIADGWQLPMVEGISTHLESLPEVVALAQFGSTANDECDLWSDIDLLLVLKDGVPRYDETPNWLENYGDLLAVERYPGENNVVVRACFCDMRRLDLVITTEGRMKDIQEWGAVYLWKPLKICFCRSDQILIQFHQRTPLPKPSLLSAEDFDKMVNRFWFCAVTAVTKVVRNDLLIALHLALELVQESCVLQMLHRDKLEGTSHHKRGGVGNTLVATLNHQREDYTAEGILNTIDVAAQVFDKLAKEWTDAYTERHCDLLPWIDKSRQKVT